MVNLLQITTQQQEKINRPMNCFMIYKRDKKHAILEDNPMINFRDISKIVADQWREEREEVKEHYKTLAKIEMKNHQEKYPDYRFPSSKGKHGKKKASKLAIALSKELKRSVGRPKKISQGVNLDKSEKLQEYIEKLKNINGIQFQDASAKDGASSQSGNSTLGALSALNEEQGFIIPDAKDAIYKDRVLPPLVQNRGYVTPVKSEYFLPIKKNSQKRVGVSSVTPVNTPMNRHLNSPVMDTSQKMIGAQGVSSSTQEISLQISSLGKHMNRNMPQVSHGAQPMNRNMSGIFVSDGNRNLSCMPTVSQQMPVTMAQQQQINRALVSQQTLPAAMTTDMSTAPSLSQNPAAVSHLMPNARSPMALTHDQKSGTVKTEDIVERQIQRVGTPSSPIYNSYTSPMPQKSLMATPEQSPQNLSEGAQFRNVQPMEMSEISDSPSRSIQGTPSHLSSGSMDHPQMENVSTSPKRGRPRGASSPGQQYSFLCEICGSSFVRRHDLKRHLLLHSGLGPYRCACGRHFSRQDFFSRHMQTCRSKATISPPESPALSVDESNAPSQL